MSSPSKAPAYNLKVVIRETGLKPDTLRAWERRYGLPNPQRTSGGHRLYSQYDIEMIKWLIERQNEGLRINRAVQLWRSFEEQDQDPLQAIPVIEEPMQPAPGAMFSGTTLDDIREDWVAACLAFDEARAENLLAQAFARYPMETVCLEVLRQGLSQVGEFWYTGESTVQQEHFSSALAIRRLNALLAAAPPPARRGKILAACPPEEEHVFSLLLMTVLLRYRGWPVIYLGANVPIDRLDITIQSSQPDLIVLTAQQLLTAASLFEVAQYLVSQGTPFAFGGLIFNLLPELQNRIPGFFLGDSLEGVVQSVEYLLASSPGIPLVEDVPAEYHQASLHFKELHPRVDLYLWEQFQTNGMKEHHLEIANDFLGRDIQAGLILGDLNLLKHEIDWLTGLLKNQNIPPEYLPKYITLYKQAIQANLDQRGQPIIDWLESIVY